MKIGFVSAHPFTYPGGVQKHILALKKEFKKRGHSVKMISPQDIQRPLNLLREFEIRKKLSQKKDKNIIFFGSALYIPGDTSKTNLSLAINPLSILRKLRKEKFDILHFQNFGVFISLQILELSKRISRPPINILTFHALLDTPGVFKEMPFLIDVFDDYILPRFDGIIGTSKPVLNQLKYEGPKEIIPNGIDTDFFNPKGEKIDKFVVSKPRSDLEEGLNILFVGRIEKRKGLVYLLKAFEILKQKYKKLGLIIVGEGGRRRKMEKFVEKHKIPDVFFEGEVKESDLPRYYRTCDICCFPAIYGEGFGIVLLEAMASQKPVVAFANQGYREVLIGKGSEFLVKPKDIEGLAKKLEILIKNKDKREKMGKWGRGEAKKYSWSKIANRTLKFYDKVIRYKNL